MIERKIATAISVTSLGIVLSGTAIFADAKVGTVTASALNIRSGPSTSSSVVTKAYKGNKVEILETSNGWYKVKLSNGKVGWGSGEYITTSNSGGSTETPSTGTKATVTASTLNVRSGPSTSNSVVTKAYRGNTVEILESSNGWNKIKLSNGKIGWASAQYISTSGDTNQGGGNTGSGENTETPSTGTKATVTASTLNVRSGPSTSNSVVTKAYRGNTVEILESSNGWNKIKLSNGKIGWASAQYISTSGDTNQGGGNTGSGENTETPSTGTKATVTASTLNVRSGPSTSNSVVTKAYRGDTVEILESSNGWNKIKLSNGKIGWASAQYISTSGDVNQGGGNTGSEDNNNGSNVETSNKAQAIVNTAKAQIGKPEKWGAEGPNSFDCSGLTSYVYRQHGITLPRTSSQQANVGTTVSKSDLQPGDLVFFSTNGSGSVSHVGIYIGNGQMVHTSSSKKSVATDNINSSYWQKAYIRAKRVI